MSSSAPESKVSASAPRYDQKTAQEAIALAARLQDEHRETMTVAQVEAVAAEIGVAPEFVHAALQQVETKNAEPETTGDKIEDFFIQRDKRLIERRRRVRNRLRSIKNIPPGLWWALGWLLPAIAAILTDRAGGGKGDNVVVPLMGLLYVGMGIFLSIMSGGRKDQTTVQPSSLVQNDVSREQLLETLFAVQQQLQSQGTTRAFLSIDVVGSSEMKAHSLNATAEYSFGQYRRWVEERVRAGGGRVEVTDDDGLLCVFDTELAALETANRLLADLPRFNTEENMMSQPFRIRCGVSAGKVAVDEGTPLGNWQSTVIDQAALLQKQAAPNTVAVGSGNV